MWESKITKRYVRTSGERICQGDILRDVKFNFSLDDVSLDSSNSVLLKYAVVMSQDCDLETDYTDRSQQKDTHDKLLPTVLLCPAYPSGQFVLGTHIEGRMMGTFNGSNFIKIKDNNQYNRYHYLCENNSEEDPLTDLVIDFKHFYTVPTDILYKQFSDSYIVSVNELFRERLAQRFANYLSRFGLPVFDRNAE